MAPSTNQNSKSTLTSLLSCPHTLNRPNSINSSFKTWLNSSHLHYSQLPPSIFFTSPYIMGFLWYLWIYSFLRVFPSKVKHKQMYAMSTLPFSSFPMTSCHTQKINYQVYNSLQDSTWFGCGYLLDALTYLPLSYWHSSHCLAVPLTCLSHSCLNTFPLAGSPIS